MGTIVHSPSKKSTLQWHSSCDDYKKSDIQISLGKEEYRKNTHHFPFKWSFRIFELVAFYLFMTLSPLKSTPVLCLVINPHPTNWGPIGPQVIINVYRNLHDWTTLSRF